jgi:hypothetical protein
MAPWVPVRTHSLTIANTLINEDHLRHLQGEFVWLFGSK